MGYFLVKFSLYILIIIINLILVIFLIVIIIMIFLISFVQNYFTINKIISNIMRIFYINSKKNIYIIQLFKIIFLIYNN